MRIKRIAAYSAIYLFWGGSYLPIRYVVHVVPPLFTAAVRYTLGGLLLTIVPLLMKRQQLPTRKQAINAATTGIALLTVSYGVVYWAATRLPSWIVAVLVSTIFLWTCLGESLVLWSGRLRAKTLWPAIVGLGGMPLLLHATFEKGKMKSLIAAIAVLLGSCLWAATTLAVQRIELPRSYVQTAALQLCASGLTLFCISFISGEFTRLPTAQQAFSPGILFSVAYLVLASSLLGFTAFHWLLAHESAAMVATSAYVNPVVAMLLGIVLGHERWSGVQLLGTLVVLGSIVFVWNTQRSPSSPVESDCRSPGPDQGSDGLAVSPAQ